MRHIQFKLRQFPLSDKNSRTVVIFDRKRRYSELFSPSPIQKEVPRTFFPAPQKEVPRTFPRLPKVRRRDAVTRTVQKGPDVRRQHRRRSTATSRCWQRSSWVFFNSPCLDVRLVRGFLSTYDYIYDDNLLGTFVFDGEFGGPLFNGHYTLV